jgi:hypothetical protein
MGFLRTTYNVKSMSWDIDATEIGHDHNEVQLNFCTTDDQEMDISYLEFGITLKKDGVELLTSHHPVFPIQYEKIKTSIFHVSTIDLVANEDYVIEAYARDKETQKAIDTKSVTFKTPKPPKPFQSWIWNSATKTWDPPVPHPDPVLGVDDYVEGRKLYQWIEAEQQWLEGLPEDFAPSESNS